MRSLSAYDDKLMCLFSIADVKVTMMEQNRNRLWPMPSEGLSVSYFLISFVISDQTLDLLTHVMCLNVIGE